MMIPKGVSDDVLVEAYRASRRLESEIRTKWDGLQIDLTSGYPHALAVRPQLPRLPDRSFEVVLTCFLYIIFEILGVFVANGLWTSAELVLSQDGEFVRARERKEKVGRKERKLRSQSQSRSRSKSPLRPRKKMRRNSPRVRCFHTLSDMMLALMFVFLHCWHFIRLWNACEFV